MKNDGRFKKGHKNSPEVRKKMSDSHRGVSRSPEIRRKISEGKKGKPTWILGKTHSEATRKKIGNAHRGEKCNFWKGGVSEPRGRHMGRRYVNWRTKVFKRDDWTCQMCGSRKGDKEAHHVRSWSNFPLLRYRTKNGTTLCKRPCHILANREQRKVEMKGGDRRLP
jgi:hypothetical protein